MYITLTISCVLIVVCIIAWYFKRREKMSLFKRLGIPGPEPNLFTGNLMAFFGTPNVEFYSNLINRYGPIVGYYLGSKPMIITKHLGFIKEIQRSRDFEDRPRLVPGGINPSSKRCKMLGNLPVNEWRELRKKLNTGFTTTQLRQMVPLVQQKIDKFIDKLSDKEGFEIDFYKYYQRLTLDIIGRTAFGVDTDVQYNRNDRFLIAVKQEFVKTANNFLVKLLLCFSEFYYIIQGFRKLVEYVKETIGLTSTSLLWTDCETTLMMRKFGQRVADDGKDLLQIMIDKGLSDECIIAQTILFNEAAFETMSASLAFITHILLNNNHITQHLAKEVEEFVQNNDLDYSVENNLPVMDSVINETLRLYPPQTTFISRCNPTQDFVYEDPSDGKHYTIPKGIQIQVALYQIHRDDNNYSNANHFNAYRFIDRSGNRVNMGTNGEYSVKWQPFGRGGRDCIGKTYARIVLKLILSNLLLKFRLNTTENTARDGDLEIVYKTATMTPKNGIYGSVSAHLP